MDHTARIATRFLLRAKLDEIYGNGFQDFFHDLMCLRYPDFLDVKTAGQLGDLGSDGLTLVTRKLYSCYGPETVEAGKAVDKVHGDLTKAIDKRPGQFDTFVFVHSDRRGMHPTISAELARLASANPSLKFENFGFRRFRDEACRLDQSEVEDLLGQPLPVQQVVYSVDLEEIAPLLEHLQKSTETLRPNELIPAISQQKLAYNDFSEDVQDDLRRAIVRSAVVDEYYASGYAVTERDEVAAAFRVEFERVRAAEPNAHPDDLLYQMELFLLGNMSPRFSARRAALVVLAYFFESCDIFDDVPSQGESQSQEAGSR